MSRPALGFGLPVSGPWATVDHVQTVATRAEQAGYASLWTFQRLLHPADGDWGPMYRAVTDPLITLAYTAAVTRTCRLGVAVVNAPFYSPVGLAKMLVTLDLVSRGRLDAGLGLGWAAEEFEATGAPFERRGDRTAEFVRCLRAIFGPDPVRFDGEFYRVPPSEVDPKPVQPGGPPILLGGDAPRALRRVGQLADGWISRSRHDLTAIGGDIATIRRAAEDSGRSGEPNRFIVRGVLRLSDTTSDDATDRRPLSGTAAQIRDDLERLGDAGVTEVFIDPNFDPAICAPGTDPDAALSRALRLLETFAPEPDQG
jgi:probable F420-dependent oxidoreductase